VEAGLEQPPTKTRAQRSGRMSSDVCRMMVDICGQFWAALESRPGWGLHGPEREGS